MSERIEIEWKPEPDDLCGALSARVPAIAFDGVTAWVNKRAACLRVPR